MNIQGTLNKLLLAFSKQFGIDYKINVVQFYSEKLNKTCTKYILFEEHPKKDGVEFFSKTKLVVYLAGEYKKLNGDIHE